MTEVLRDGCVGFDEQLMDLAVQPVATPELEAHIAICVDCQVALEQYADTAKVISASLTLGGAEPTGPSGTAGPDRPPPVRRAGSRILSLLAASLLTAAASLLLGVNWSDPLPPTISVLPMKGAIVQLMGPDRAVIQEGTSTFVIRDGTSVVETPVGPVSCDSCEFTVEIGSCTPGDAFPSGTLLPANLCVTLSVASGQVGSLFDDRQISMGPGQSLTWPMMPAGGVPVPR